MEKVTFAIKIDGKVMRNFKSFCRERGVKYSFFVEEAIKEKIHEEELKDDILELKSLQKEEKLSIPHLFNWDKDPLTKTIGKVKLAVNNASVDHDRYLYGQRKR